MLAEIIAGVFFWLFFGAMGAICFYEVMNDIQFEKWLKQDDPNFPKEYKTTRLHYAFLVIIGPGVFLTTLPFFAYFKLKETGIWKKSFWKEKV